MSEVIDFSNIIGHTDMKKELIEYADSFINHYQEYQEYLKAINADGAKGLMLHGLPGIGKSMTLKAVEDSLKNHPDIEVKYYDRSSFMGTIGNNAQKIQKIFDEARSTKKKLFVMLIDEADGIMAPRGEFLNANERTGEFITQIQGMRDSSKILILATTNDIKNVDSAIKDRFDLIELLPPDKHERKEFIRKYFAIIKLEKPITDETLNTFVVATAGFTGRNYMQISKKLKSIEMRRDSVSMTEMFAEIAKYHVRASIVSSMMLSRGCD